MLTFIKGYDSTANTLSWFAKFMEANQRVQTELRSILKRAFPESNPSVEQILGANLPYLDGVCEETLRLAGAAKAQLRQAVVDTEILGCRVPKGAQVFMNLHINRAPYPTEESTRSATSQAAGAKFGDGFQTDAGRDIAAFEPKRWLVKDEKTGREIFNSHALPSLAFGGGLRGCIGESASATVLQTSCRGAIQNATATDEQCMELSTNPLKLYCRPKTCRDGDQNRHRTHHLEL